MVLAMDGLQSAQGQMRVHLCSGNVGVTKNHLHATQVCAVFHHVRGATMPQTMRAGGLV